MASKPPAPGGQGNGTFPVLPWRGAVLIILGICLLGAWGVRDLTIVEDITQLLPKEQTDDVSSLDIGREFGLMNNVVLLIGPSEGGTQTLHRAVDLIEVELGALDGAHCETSGVFEQGAAATAEIVLQSAPRLYRSQLDEINRQVAKERLESLRKRLAAPESIAMGSLFLKDPLGLANNALESLGAVQESIGAVVEEGHLLSEDRSRALVSCQLDFNPMEIARSESFLEELDAAVARAQQKFLPAQVPVVSLGGVHFSCASAQAMRRDVALAFVITGLGILVVFALFFRRLRILPAALLPGGLGIAVATWVMALLGYELHALTIGFAATIAGISVDYAIHLLYAGLAHEGPSTLARIQAGLRSIWKPATSACLTTLAAFVLISTSGFPGIRQLAIFSSIAVPTALLATFFVLPPFHGFIFGAGRPPRVLGPASRLPRRKTVLIALGALLVIVAVGGSRIRISGDPRELGPDTSELHKRQEQISAVFNGAADQLLLVASGSNLQQALEINDRLYNWLTGAQIPKQDIVSLSPLIPSLATQTQALAEVARLYDGELLPTFAAAGFTAEYYGQLKQGLDTAALFPHTYASSPVKKMIDSALQVTDERTLVLTRLHLPADGSLEALVEMSEEIPGLHIVSERLRTQGALSRLQKELLLMLTIWLIASMVVLGLIERSFLFGIKAVLPAGLGVALTVGIVGLLGRPLTPVATAGITLVLGLGIDYGIFALKGESRSQGTVRSAIFASAITTMAAFGGLSLARTRAMSDMGIIILTGIVGATLVALYVMPLLNEKRTHEPSP